MEELRYEDSQVDERIVRAVTEMGFEAMTPIQQMAIPAMLEGKDIIGQAQTGTGKTAAFGIPIVQLMDPEDESVQAIVLCPTRELAIQAAEEIRHFAKFMHGVKVLPVYGGQDIEKQIRSLRSKVTIVVGTPGRVLDHMRRHTLKLGNIKMVVLDEADEMLNMGFKDSIEDILAAVPEHQTALFSATMPQAILNITKEFQKEDAVKIKIAKKELTIPLVKQYYYEVKRQNKEEVVSRLLDYYNPKLSLIFCNTKRMVDELTDNLKGRGYFAEGLHGDMSQAQRDKVMKGFRTGSVEILIATDVAARGIDVDDVEAVFNFDIPQDNEYYVHRIGRTGRAGRKGRSFTLVVGKEIYRIRDIERACNTKITARVVPTAADITEAKSHKIFADAIKLTAESDLTPLVKLIENVINDEDITAIELCAALLKQYIGEDKEDIPEESYFRERDERRRNGGDRGDGRRDGRRGGRDGRNGRRNDRSDFGNDGDKRGENNSGNQRRGDRHDGARRFAGGRDERRDWKKKDDGFEGKKNDEEKSFKRKYYDGKGKSFDNRGKRKPAAKVDLKSVKAKDINNKTGMPKGYRA